MRATRKNDDASKMVENEGTCCRMWVEFKGMTYGAGAHQRVYIQSDNGLEASLSTHFRTGAYFFGILYCPGLVELTSDLLRMIA